MRKQRCRMVFAAAGTCLLMVALAPALSAHARRFSAWSAPENLGPPVNTAFLDAGPFVSRDELSIYFTSNRPGGFGANDLWVSHRESVNHPWGPPVNLGEPINSSGNEQTPTLSRDGRRLYFASDRPGGYGGLDLYVSRRDKRQDSGWGEPVNLGSEINTSAIEFGPAPFHDDDGRILYFSSGRPGGLGLADIYVIRLHGDESFGPAELVVELSSPANDFRPAIRRDGLEIFLDSDRPRSLGGLDIWFSTRARISDPWSLPQNLTVVNSPTSDARPAPSFDGTRLYFSSDRPGGSGNQDIYVSSRTALRPGDGDDDDGKHDDDDDDDD